MAGEITLTITLTLANGSLRASPSQGTSQEIDQGAARRHSDTQNIGTTAEALGTGSIVTPGVGWFENLDDTNFVEVGKYTGGAFHAFLKLNPGEGYAVRIACAAAELYAKADTAAVELDFSIFED